MRKIVFIFTIVVLYSFTENKTETETGFSKVCFEIAKNFRKYDHGKLVYNKTSKDYVQPKKFANIIESLNKYDIERKANYKVEKITSENIEKIIWKDKNSKDIIEKKVFKAKKYENQSLTITEYILSRKEKPNYIRLRIIENEFEELIIDKTIYNSSYFESRLVGANEAVEELNKLEK